MDSLRDGTSQGDTLVFPTGVTLNLLHDYLPLVRAGTKNQLLSVGALGVSIDLSSRECIALACLSGQSNTNPAGQRRNPAPDQFSGSQSPRGCSNIRQRRIQRDHRARQFHRAMVSGFQRATRHRGKAGSPQKALLGLRCGGCSAFQFQRRQRTGHPQQGKGPCPRSRPGRLSGHRSCLHEGPGGFRSIACRTSRLWNQ